MSTLDEKISIEKLADNWTTWKFQVKHLLLAKGLWAFVDGTETRPTDVTLAADFDKKGESARTKSTRALDCGAGIGRITKRLLLPLFDTVDLVDVNKNFVNEAKTFIGEESKRVGEFIVAGLQDFVPKEEYYNVIWIQWVLGHLSDDDLVLFFQRCKKGIVPGGLVCIKENCGASAQTNFDKVDSSYTRPKTELVKLIEKSGLRIIQEEKQKGFPKQIYDVWMFACE